VLLCDRLPAAALLTLFSLEGITALRWVPQLADARDVLARIATPPPGVRFSVLTPNMKACSACCNVVAFAVNSPIIVASPLGLCH